MKTYKLSEPIYDGVLNIFIDCEKKEALDIFNRKEKKQYEPIDSGACLFYATDGTGTRGYLWIEKFNWTIWEQTAVLHEIFHFVNEVLRGCGIEHMRETEEAYAYYLDFWMTKVWELLKPKK